MPGTEIRVRWQGRSVPVYVPDRLADLHLTPSAVTARALERAAGAVRRADEHLPARFAPLFLLLLRAEGIASSNIEGLRAPLADVAAAEVAAGVSPTADAVADNLRAVVAAIGDARDQPVDAATLDRWHATLMRDARQLSPEQVGSVRTEQSWIGGLSPLNAAFVPPPAALVPELLADLVAYANRDDVDPIEQAAVVHVQFESIHPYADGNGRIGRVLVSWVLTRRLQLATPPPISVAIAADRGGYLATMTQWRLGPTDPWLAWFAAVTSAAAESAYVLVDRLEELQQQWAGRLQDRRADATALALLELLPSRPALTAAVAAEEAGVSVASARSALRLLTERGVLEPFTPAATARGRGRPQAWFVAPGIVRLVTSWTRG